MRNKYIGSFISNEQLLEKDNTLVISPIGSGKTTYVFTELSKEFESKDILYLCDTSNLKNNIKLESQLKYENRILSHNIMTYNQLAKNIRLNDDFIKRFKLIVADEIHNLMDYDSKFGGRLSLVTKLLINKINNVKVVMFTATPLYVNRLFDECGGNMKNINIIDLTNETGIKRYINLSVDYINHLSQVQFTLNKYKEGFYYKEIKCLIYTKEISEMKYLEGVCKAQGIKAISIWSSSNLKYALDDEQNRFKDHLFKTGQYIDDYQCLIINASSETGINITDPKVNLAIINSTNETTITQARGRIRRDINLLVVRTNEADDVNFKVIIPGEWLNIPLNTDDKKRLCKELNIRDKNRNG